MADFRQIVPPLIIGVFVGLLIAKAFDPPPPELVKAISKSEWARRLAEAYISDKIPEPERTKLINEMAEKLAEKLASRLWA